MTKRDLPMALLCGLIGLASVLGIRRWGSDDLVTEVVFGALGFVGGGLLYAAVVSYHRSDSVDRQEAQLGLSGLAGSFVGIVLVEYLNIQSLWGVPAVIAAGVVGGMSALALWRRRSGGPDGLPEKLTSVAKAMRVYRAGKNEDDQREYAAVTALQRMTADGTADKSEVAAFARAELDDYVRRPVRHGAQDYTYHSKYDGPTLRMIELLAIAAPDDEEAFLAGLLGTPGDRFIKSRLAELRQTPITDRDGDYVRDALQRLEAVGLVLKPQLDRELIVARALLEAHLWRYLPGDPPESGSRFAPDPIAPLFSVLARETDAFLDRRAFQIYRREPERLHSLRLSAERHPALDAHSGSIFANAAYVEISDYEQELFSTDLCHLSRGDIILPPTAWSGTSLTIQARGRSFKAALSDAFEIEAQQELFDRAARGLDHRFLFFAVDGDGEFAAYLPADRADAFSVLVIQEQQ